MVARTLLKVTLYVYCLPCLFQKNFPAYFSVNLMLCIFLCNYILYVKYNINLLHIAFYLLVNAPTCFGLTIAVFILHNINFYHIYFFFFSYYYYLFEIFTICFKEPISKLFERLHFEGRCYPVIVLPRVEHFLIIIVFYCNTSVGHCRCSLLLASGGGGGGGGRVVGSLVRLSAL